MSETPGKAFSFMAHGKEITLFEINTDIREKSPVNDDQPGLLLTAVQFAELLHIATSTLWRLHSAGKVPLPMKIGGSTRWRTDEIRAWVDAGCPSREKWIAIREAS